MRNQIILFIFIFFTMLGAAQPQHFIKGQLVDINQKPIAGIQIALLNARDSGIVKVELSAQDGTFQFDNLDEDAYQLFIEDIDYKVYQSEFIVISSEKPNSELFPIILAPNEINELDAVVLVKKKPFVEHKIDRTVVNVDAFITAAGGNAMDILEKSPGILVDQNGTITFKGKSGIQVFIDDKPTYLSGVELESYLKSLPVGTLDKIELMTNPPAKYDAEGGAGIINIVSKRSMSKGFNAALNSRVSKGKKYGSIQDLNVNYMNNKIRLFGNIGYGENNPISDLFILRKFKDDTGNIENLFYQNSIIESEVNTSNVRIGADYYVTDKTTLGLGLTGVLNKRNRLSVVNSEITDANSEIDSTVIADNSQREQFKNIGVNMNLRQDLDSLGQKINVALDYLNYDISTKQTFNNAIFQPDNSLSSQDQLKGHLPSTIDIYSFKADYTLPMKNGTFETGYKVSYTKTDNIADYRKVIEGTEIPDYESSNHFKYDETINAAYGNYNFKYKRFDFQMGLRLENTISKGNQLGNREREAEKFKRSYTNLFPTIFVKYELDTLGVNSLAANYGKRVNRPYFQMLNPFISPLDKFTYYLGNPFLNPVFTNTYELSYYYKSAFSATFNYSYAKDNITETIQIRDGIYYSQPGNIGKSEYLSLNLNAQLPFFKWWSANVYNEITHAKFQSQLFTEKLESSGTYWIFSLNNSFKFKKGWSAEISGHYQTDIVNTQFVLLAKSRVNIGLQKKLLDDRASIKLSFNDVFYSNINNGIINNLKNTDATWRSESDTRFLALTFSYNYGKSFTPKNHYNSDAVDSEKNRVSG